jgi:hypothetical protein
MGIGLLIYILCKRLQIRPDMGAGYLGAVAPFRAIFFTDLAFNPLPIQLILISHRRDNYYLPAWCAAFDKMIASAGATILGFCTPPFLGVTSSRFDWV